MLSTTCCFGSRPCFPKRKHATRRFWQRGGGYDRNLWSPRAIWNEVTYVHMNPVEAGLCERPSDWKWSSARQYHLREEGPIHLDPTHMPPKP